MCLGTDLSGSSCRACVLGSQIRLLTDCTRCKHHTFEVVCVLVWMQKWEARCKACRERGEYACKFDTGYGGKKRGAK